MVATDHWRHTSHHHSSLQGLVVGVSTVGTGGLGPTLLGRIPSVAPIGYCGMFGGQYWLVHDSAIWWPSAYMQTIFLN